MPAGVAAGICCPLDLLGPRVLPPFLLGARWFCPLCFVVHWFCHSFCVARWFCHFLFVAPQVLPHVCVLARPLVLPPIFGNIEQRQDEDILPLTVYTSTLYPTPYPLPKTSLSDLPAINYIVAFIPALFTHFDIS